MLRPHVRNKHIVSLGTFTRNLLANWVGLFAEVLAAFFLTPFIVASLGLTTYGIWSLLNGLVGYMGLIDLGIRGSTGRYINHYMAKNDNLRINQVINTSIFFLSGLSILGVIFAVIFSTFFIHIFTKTPVELLNDIQVVLPIMAINLWLAFIIAVLRHTLNAHDRFEISNGINLVILFIRVVGVIIALNLDYGLIGLICANVFASFIGCIVYLFAALNINKTLKISWQYVNLQRFKEMWKFGTAVFITRGANQLIYQADQILVMIFFGPKMVGIYSIATMILQNASKLIEQINGTLYPSVMKSGSIKDIDSLKKLFLWNANLTVFLGILVFVGLLGYGDHFITLWMGSGFEETYKILAIISVAAFLSLFSSNAPAILFSMDKIRLNVTLASIHAITNIIFSVIFVLWFGFGLIGIAYGTLFSSILIRFFAYPIFTCKSIGLKISTYYASTVLKGLIAVVCVYFLFNVINNISSEISWMTFMSKVAVSAFIYLLVFGFVFLPKDKILLIRDKIKQ